MNDNEPSFFIFSLHDVRKRKKISEDWSIMVKTIYLFIFLFIKVW